MGKQFSTHEIRAEERFDYWHELVYRTYAPCNARVQSMPDFEGRLKISEFGTAEISDVSSTGIRYERTSYDVRCGPRDDFFVSFMLAGECNFEQNGRHVRHRAGDVLLYDSAQPYVYRYEHKYHSILMRIPRPLASARFVDVERLGGAVLCGRTAFGKLLGTMLSEARDLAETVDQDTLQSLCPSILDTIATAVRCGTGEAVAATAGKRAKIEQVKRYLCDHISDNSLNLERVAKDQGLSVRSLCRMFSEMGATPMGWLQARRLDAAYLAISEHKVSSITNAALDFGFNDLSHFDRSFKKQFGVTPKSLL